jgi:hypothetical protein
MSKQVADATGTPDDTFGPAGNSGRDLSRTTGQPTFKITVKRNRKHMWTVSIMRHGQVVSWMDDLSKTKATRLMVVIRAICNSLGVECKVTVQR